MTSDASIGLTPTFTLVLWTICIAVGAVGLLLPHEFHRDSPPVLPVQTQLVDVQVVKDEFVAPQNATAAPISISQPPAPPEIVQSPASVPLLALATPVVIPMPPSPRPAVAHEQATQSAPTQSPPPAVSQLVIGQGQGSSIQAQYPYEAKVAQQQGLVTVKFVVGADGSVIDATADPPCPYPLLNQEALRAVRDAGPFAPGHYEVRINFALARR